MQNAESLQEVSTDHVKSTLYLLHAMTNAELSQQIRQGVTRICQDESQDIAPGNLFYLHVTAQMAFQMDIYVLLRAFWASHPEVRVKDQDLALTAIFEGWSNALLWGTLELPPMHTRDLDPKFERILSQRLRHVEFGRRFVTLTINKLLDKLVVSIRDQGSDRDFDWNHACEMSNDVYRGLSIIRNCCDDVSFDSLTKILRMEFKLG